MIMEAFYGCAVFLYLLLVPLNIFLDNLLALDLDGRNLGHGKEDLEHDEGDLVHGEVDLEHGRGNLEHGHGRLEPRQGILEHGQGSL